MDVEDYIVGRLRYLTKKILQGYYVHMLNYILEKCKFTKPYI